MSTLTASAPVTAPLHLTQILVAYEDAIRRLRIRDTYDWHQHVWKGFAGIIPPRPDKGRFAKGTRPEDQERTPPDFLCRIDEVEDSYRLLILSTTPPKKPDWCPTDCFGTKVIPDGFFAHSRYRFSLLANPTKKVVNPDKPKIVRPDGRIDRNKNSKRVPITQRDELIAWLQRKARDGGFELKLKEEDDSGKEVELLRTVPRGREFFHKVGAHGTLTAVEFQGELTVTDPAQFRATVANGIGSAKAFGFGLLVIAPIS